MRAYATGLMLLCAASAAAAPTFTRDVAPIFYKNCVSCHRPGELAPMSLLDYRSARPWAKAIRAAVATGKMPPWFADPRYGHFSNDTRLKEQDIATVKAWVDAGAAEGDPKDLPVPPKFVEGWRLGKPDLVIDIGQDFRVPAGKDLYKDFVVPTAFTEGKWIRAAQVLPGNRRLVHHVHVYVVAQGTDADSQQEAKLAVANRVPSLAGFAEIEDGLTRVREDAPVINDACAANANLPNLSGFEEGSLTTMLPGKPPDDFDVFGDGSTAKYIPAGAKLRFQIHYAKVDEAGTDRTSVGLYLVAKAPEKPLRRVDLRNRFFLIPAGAGNHEVKRCYDVEQDKLLVAITPHMHYRGKDATYELIHADGRHEILLVVPHYDFNWQLQYRFEKAILMEKGSRMVVTFHYDNSPNNPANPEPSKAIRWGDRTEDEMMVTWTETINVSPAGSSLNASAGK
ncbi:MAG: cytochrome c [Acidobacteriia bacterium]|nr:cytochrome c [Terriglobia bacterium]